MQPTKLAVHKLTEGRLRCLEVRAPPHSVGAAVGLAQIGFRDLDPFLVAGRDGDGPRA